MARFEFKLPDIGEGVVEGEIVKWLVKAGDAVAEDQGLVEVMTDKATVTIGCPRKGRISQLNASIGERGGRHPRGSARRLVFCGSTKGGQRRASGE